MTICEISIIARDPEIRRQVSGPRRSDFLPKATKIDPAAVPPIIVRNADIPPVRGGGSVWRLVGEMEYSVEADSEDAEYSGASKARERTGRWTRIEHETFLNGLRVHGKVWKKVSTRAMHLN